MPYAAAIGSLNGARHKAACGGPRCLDQKTVFIRETGASQAQAFAGGGSGAAQASRSGAAAPTGNCFSTTPQALGDWPTTCCSPRYTSHGV
jgi:hypothetical protein